MGTYINYNVVIVVEVADGHPAPTGQQITDIVSCYLPPEVDMVDTIRVVGVVAGMAPELNLTEVR